MNCLCLSVAYILSLLTILSLPSIKSQNCGQFIYSSGLIVNGEDTVKGEFPHLIALLLLPHQTFFCAANLISQRHAVTAAHCMINKYSTKALNKEDFVALLGRYNLKTVYERGAVSMEIKKIDIHEDWKTHSLTYDADIALLTFEGDVPLSAYVQIVCMPSKWDAQDLKEGIAVGWGYTERSGFSKPEDTPRKMQIIKPPTNEFCFLHEQELVMISSNRTFCAAGDNKGVCSGDSGGGMIVKSNSVWTIQGIVSSTILDSSMKCDSSKYSVYTNVAHFVDWIFEKATASLEINSSPVQISENTTFKMNSFPALPDVTSVGTNSYPIDMNCDFQIFNLYGSETYGCRLKIGTIASDNLMFSRVKGSHIFGKTNTDAEHLSFGSKEDVKPLEIHYIPSGISDFLPNIITFYLQHAKLERLSRKSFKRFSKLEVISLTDNHIQHIDEDTFYEVPSLYSLRLNSNKLKTIPFNLLIHSNMLESFEFHVNRIEEFDGDIFRNCPLMEYINLRSNKLKKIRIKLVDLKNLMEFSAKYNYCINSDYMKDDSTITIADFQNQIDSNC